MIEMEIPIIQTNFEAEDNANKESSSNLDILEPIKNDKEVKKSEISLVTDQSNRACVRWISSYDGSRMGSIGGHTPCMQCKDYLKLSLETKHNSFFCSHGTGIQTFATHPVYNIFAYSENIPNPSIYIVLHPDFNLINTIEDEGLLEYQAIEFSTQNLMATLSGIPKFELIVWKYSELVKVYKTDLLHTTPLLLSFNSLDQCLFALAYHDHMLVWKLDVSVNAHTTMHVLKAPSVEQKLTEEWQELRTLMSLSTNDFMKTYLNMPNSTMTDLPPNEFEMFLEDMQSANKLTFQTFVWGLNESLIVACKEGYLVKFRLGESSHTLLSKITTPPGAARTAVSEPQHSKLKLDLVMPSKKEILMKAYSSVFEVKKQSEFVDQSSEEHLVQSDGVPTCMFLLRRSLVLGLSNGVVHFLDLVGEDSYVEVKSHMLHQTIESFSPSVNTLYVGTKEGGLFTLNPSMPDKQPLQKFTFNSSPIIELAVFYTLEPLFVTLKKSGLVEVWNNDGVNVSSLMVPSSAEVTTMGASSMLNMVAVGTASGLIYVGVFQANTKPRWLLPKKIHYQAVIAVQFFPNSVFFVVAYEDAKVFLACATAHKNFNPIAYMDLKEDGFHEIVCLSVSHFEKDLCLCLLVKHVDASTMVVSVCINPKTLIHRPDYVIQKDFKLNERQVNKSICRVKGKVVSMVLFTTRLLAIMHSDHRIAVYRLVHKDVVEADVASSSSEKEVTDMSDFENLNVLNNKSNIHNVLEDSQSISDPDFNFVTEEDRIESITKINSELVLHLEVGPFPFEGASMEASSDSLWVLSGWKDGTIRIHDVQNGNLLWSRRCLSFWDSGVERLCLSVNGRFVVFSGTDMFCCNEITPTNEGLLTAEDLTKAHEQAVLINASMKPDQRNEYVSIDGMKTLTERNLKADEDISFEEDDEYIERKIEAAIAKDLIYNPPIAKADANSSWMQQRLLKKLSEDEMTYGPVRFALRSQVWKLRQKLKQLIIENDEASELEKIAFHEFNPDLAHQKSFKEECEAEVTKMKKEKEITNNKKKKLVEMIKTLCWKDMLVKGREIKAFLTEYSVSNYPLKERTVEETSELNIVHAQRRVEVADILLRQQSGDQFLRMKKSKQSVKSEEEAEKEETVSEKNNKESFYGSLGFSVGGDNELFYNQFEICTRWQKIRQIVMLKDSIHRIQLEFNKEFDENFKKKEAEMLMISKRNTRIRSIMTDLDMSPETVLEPSMGNNERPELLFETKDEEVMMHKLVGPWNKPEVVGQDEGRDAGGDNWRERGLEKMMGGLLEIKKEDELKKKIPCPSFMSEKAEEKWNEDERKLVMEFKAAVKTQDEEKEKYKKVLEMELKKLQGAITEGMQRFDAALVELFDRKVIVQSALYQDELKMLRLRNSMLLEEMMDKRDDELRDRLRMLKEHLNHATTKLSQAKREHEEFQAMYDSHVEEDKLHDKMFRKEFQDVPQPITDLLYKLYKKRAKVLKSKLANKKDDFMPLETLDADVMSEYDSSRNMPEGISLNVWTQLCAYRHEKIVKETYLKSKLGLLLELQMEHTLELNNLEIAKKNLDDTYNAINQLGTFRYQFYRNVELQMLMKQGQVEVDLYSSVLNFNSCLLIHRDVIEELNKNIKLIGENKIATMVESKDFKKGIAQLEWEHSKMEMELQDLKNKMKDIDNFKVTKEVLFFLEKENYDEMKNQEVLTLEKTFNMAKIYHDKNIRNKNGRLEELSKSMQSLMANNEKLKEELKKLNGAILLRKKIHDVVVDKSGMAKIEMHKKHKMMVEKHRLMQVSKVQANEISSLKQHIQLLRKKTFPSLEIEQQQSTQVSCLKNKYAFVDIKRS